ncbi:DUF4082 domain-containing protein [Streptosporangium sp. NPDC087985]|uniref:DUF4082 domain-containing protein n=1 Tax=Streptosporangium sp. NPDC087985 TaxID=3366196 RepID=UPI0037F1A8B7
MVPIAMRAFGVSIVAVISLPQAVWAQNPVSDISQGELKVVSALGENRMDATLKPIAPIAPVTPEETSGKVHSHPTEVNPTPSVDVMQNPSRFTGLAANGMRQERHVIRSAARVGGKKAGAAAARSRALRADCPPTSIICLENSLPGSPPSEWDIPGAGSSHINGYAAQISVNKGEVVQFKVNTSVTAYRMDIYRIGYYGGMGARKITTIRPSVSLPQIQPACLSDAATGLVDCGNWSVSASWAVPSDAVSGVYIANMIREDGVSGASQLIFIVRDDAGNSDLLFQTSDATWQAYNTYGGNSLYVGSPAGRAFKVSYNRPVITRAGWPETYFYDSEYPMVRWLEANSYNVSYTSSVDTVIRGSELLKHKVFLTVGHAEYWSKEMRDNVENARNNGVNIAFFSGNDIFWKTRWENSIDGTNTSHRTLVCYKETLANAKIDPNTQWTGTWRDPRFSPPSDGGRPENAVTGTLFRVNGNVSDSIAVPAAYGSMRFWRNTSVASLQPGQTAVFPAGTLGYEWNESPEDVFTPQGPVRLSETTLANSSKILLDFGGTYGAGIATHRLTLYKHTSGALVFGAGTIQWSWGLDANHDRGAGTPTDIRMQQATVNLFADMRVQPATLQPGLVPATASTDTTPPTSTITSPSSGASVEGGASISIEGTAADTGGGVVAGVEVSVDGGTTWSQATGRTNWKFDWATNTTGPVTILSRAVDDIGNLQKTPTSRSVTVNTGCPCTIWPPDAVPAEASKNDPKRIEVGVKFRSKSPGYVSGIRFYKGSLNTGTHTGNLWSSTGVLLASATFTNETASGWQQVNFSTPVTVNANTTYVASYFTTSGFYSVTRDYFTQAYSNGLLTALADGTDGGNGVYSYGSASTFPTNTYRATNAWVDVVFSELSTLWDETTVPDVPSQPDTQPVALGVKFQASVPGFIRGIRFYKGPQNTGTHTGSLWTSSGQLLAQATFTAETASGWQQAIFATPVAISANTTYIASYHTTSGYYSLTRPYFTTQYTRGRLTALADAASGGNGVYKYSATNTFPINTYKAANYWVDVLFDGNQSQTSARQALRQHPVSDFAGPSAMRINRSRDAAEEKDRPSSLKRFPLLRSSQS